MLIQNILVTGGCGFIGSEFIRQQLRLPETTTIVNLDKLTYAGNLENLATFRSHPRYVFHRGDITDRDCVETLLSRYAIDAVVNFAAESHVDRSLQNSAPFVNTNVVGTQVLLDASRNAKVSRFLQVSTDEVYGSLGATGFFVEETSIAPNSPYSASKAAADMLVRAYQHSFGFPAIITRCSDNYGPYQFPEKLLPLFITNLLANQSVPVYGSGQNVRDWIHVSDHCRGIDAALRHGRPGEIYLFGGRTEKTNLEITHLLLKLLDKPTALIRYVADRLGHDNRYAVDCSKSERELGWRPEVTFEQGIQETIDWYRQNSAWVANVKSGDYLDYYARQYRQDNTLTGSSAKCAASLSFA
ncbi:MAG: strE [Planctomycetaceae bacterium]|nr:strE [Planctomycetaceae bacterium]